MTRPGRVLALDLGSKRIGVAVSDDGRRVATPIEVLARTGDRRGDHRRIAALVQEWEATTVLVGLPRSLDGGLGPAARGVLAEVDHLAATLGVPVETYDERLTTVTAERRLRELELSGPQRRRVVDAVAAAVLLQTWLDGAPA
jgi:putative holliday junction resolvase